MGPFFSEYLREKHSPYIVLNGTRGRVVVGKGAVTGDAADKIHPMEDNPDYIHFIQTMWVEDQAGNVVSMRHLSPAEPAPATMYFDIPDGATSLRAFELCNLHGLWRSAVVAVGAGAAAPGATGGCRLRHCEEGTSVSACQAFTGELQRRENFQPKTDPTGKHSPYLLLDGTTATIVVGIGATPGHEGGLIHPMSPSDDKDVVHWISHVYAVDDLGNLVALCELLPTDPAPATCVFQVPEGIGFLRPYEFCNVHGLYIGDLVQVSSGNSSAQRQCFKRECSASQPSLGPTAPRSAAVEALIQQQQEAGDRISSMNMCLQHMAVYFIRKSLVSAELQADVNRLTQEGDAASDVARRVQMFPDLFAKLNAAGGKWSARSVVFQHTMQEANGTQPTLRLDLIDEAALQGKWALGIFIFAGRASYAEGVNAAIVDVEELLLIHANFAMDWGYTRQKALGPHYTIFYSPDFVDQSVNVTLCAKTHGWMGIGWLNPDRDGGPLMQNTDMVAEVQDRFARWIATALHEEEEPLRDELLSGQRTDDAGNPLNGANHLELIPGALGISGREWCPDEVLSTKIGLIFAFARTDPHEHLDQHLLSSTGYVDLSWNLDCAPGQYFDMASAAPWATSVCA
ncbi:dfx [Symbiodinium natans]|uniref:Dfx protein n=1 Tax=Symbiodinium natans TaxID=878477 RepID=A0A812NY99_9DINO|nr:dfx [Symbiodinium natans]